MKSWSHPTSPTLEYNQEPLILPLHYSPNFPTLPPNYPPVFPNLPPRYPPTSLTLPPHCSPTFPTLPPDYPPTFTTLSAHYSPTFLPQHPPNNKQNTNVLPLGRQGKYVWLIVRHLLMKAGWWDAPLALQDLAEVISMTLIMGGSPFCFYGSSLAVKFLP